MSRKGLMEQDLSKLDVTTLHPLSPEVISRQATINIGKLCSLLNCLNLLHMVIATLELNWIFHTSSWWLSGAPKFLSKLMIWNLTYCIRHHWSCGTWKVNSRKSNIWCSGDLFFLSQFSMHSYWTHALLLMLSCSIAAV